MKVHLGAHFPKYVGGFDFKAGVEFIKEEFFARNHNQNKTIYVHTTDATSTDQFKFVWKCVKHIVMQENLRNAGLMFQ